MRNFTIGVLILFMSFAMRAQQVKADFENFGLEAGEFINNDTIGEGFKSGLVSLPNAYTPSYDSWSGWAISSMTDAVTPGFANQYSSIAGSGFDGSTTYAVAFEFGENRIDIESEYNSGIGTVGMYVSNSTYAYFSMLEGDAFAKKFGGETGEDPDFLSIVFRGAVDGAVTEDSVEFFLADFRSDVTDEDYILDEWSWVDLSSLGSVDAITINMRSSDVGAFGINTPLYFCVDNIEVIIDPLNTSYQNLEDIKLYPTLAKDNLTVELQSSEIANLEVVSLIGSPIKNIEFIGGKVDVNLSQLSSGYYFIRIQQGDAVGTKKFVKL